jgi:hypothetical protein
MSSNGDSPVAQVPQETDRAEPTSSRQGMSDAAKKLPCPLDEAFTQRQRKITAQPHVMQRCPRGVAPRGLVYLGQNCLALARMRQQVLQPVQRRHAPAERSSSLATSASTTNASTTPDTASSHALSMNAEASLTWSSPCSSLRAVHRIAPRSTCLVKGTVIRDTVTEAAGAHIDGTDLVDVVGLARRIGVRERSDGPLAVPARGPRYGHASSFPGAAADGPACGMVGQVWWS